MSPIITIIILLIVPIGTSIFFYRWMKRRGVRWAGLKTTLVIFFLFIVFPVAGLIYLNEASNHPRDSFYISVFERCTELSFPESGKILEKNVLYGHQNYEYAVIEFSKADFNSTLLKINSNKQFAAIMIQQPKSDYYNKGPEGIDSTKILGQYKMEFKKGFAIITFMKDRVYIPEHPDPPTGILTPPRKKVDSGMLTPL